MSAGDLSHSPTPGRPVAPAPRPRGSRGWAAAVTGAALADSERYRVGPAGANACNPGDARIATEAECALATRYVLDVSLAPPYSFHTCC